jgi:hypothetical protein
VAFRAARDQFIAVGLCASDLAPCFQTTTCLDRQFFLGASSVSQFPPRACQHRLSRQSREKFSLRGTIAEGGSLHNQVLTLNNERKPSDGIAQMTFIGNFHLVFCWLTTRAWSRTEIGPSSRPLEIDF